jgi:CheY-like chemotaxis protein
LELALVNLIINARDAMPAGGTVTISAENREVGASDHPGVAGGDYVRLAVTDSGSGIASDVIERVMEPFFTTKEFGKGSGLGLSMVYGFAKQSNGAFLLDSEVGRGTTAELWLPRAPAAARPRRAAPAEPRRRAKTPSLRILLVDDHAEVRTTTAAVLEDWGHRVFQAADGAEGIRVLEANDCDCNLLITDYAMPHVSGSECIRKARQHCPGLPALIITGYAEAEAIGDRPDGVEILLKPFTPAALEGAIARMVGAVVPAG